MFAYSRPVLLLLTGLVFLAIFLAVLNTRVLLWLSHASLPTWQVRLVSSSCFTGNLDGTRLAGLLIKRLGFTCSYHAACVLFALANAGLGVSDGFTSWLVLRFLVSVAGALI